MAESCQYAVLLKKSGLGIRRESFSPGAFFLSSVMHCQGQPDREKGKNKYETTKYNSNLDPDGLRWAVAKTTSGRASAGRRLSWRQHGGRAERPFESHYWGLQHGSGFLVARKPTPPVPTTQPVERSPSLATPLASPTQPPVMERSRAIPPAVTTRLTVLTHSIRTPPAKRIRRTVSPRSLATVPATRTQPSATSPASI